MCRPIFGNLRIKFSIPCHTRSNLSLPQASSRFRPTPALTSYASCTCCLMHCSIRLENFPFYLVSLLLVCTTTTCICYNFGRVWHLCYLHNVVGQSRGFDIILNTWFKLHDESLGWIYYIIIRQGREQYRQPYLWCGVGWGSTERQNQSYHCTAGVLEPNLRL